MHAAMNTLLNSPHHLLAYIAAGAALFIVIPLLRLLFRRESPTTMSLTPHSTASLAPITVINEIRGEMRAEVRGAPCIHCGVPMPSRQDFCPACGYAQPVKQTGTAARIPG